MNSFFQKEIVEVAGFPVVKYGSLLAKEEKWFEENVDEINKGYMQRFLSLVENLQAEGLELETAYQLANANDVSTLSDLNQIQRLKAVVKSYKESKEEEQKDIALETATMIICNRVGKPALKRIISELAEVFDLSDYDDSYWTKEYTELLPVTSIEELYTFALNERSRWVNVTSVDEKEEPVEKKSLTSKKA